MTDEKREQTRDLLVQDLKHYRHPKERDLLRTLESRFTSGNDVPVTRAMITREEYERLRSLLTDREGFEVQGETPKEVTKSGIPLTWGTNRRDGKEHIEWHIPCGCAYHPRPAPHWHPCEAHSPKHELSAKREGFVTVPLQATSEMIEAGRNALLEPAVAHTHKVQSFIDAQKCYSAMVAVATKEEQ